jgi:uncharacterized protein YndB with AHSA1/START domain/uncharacterized protein YciI
VSKAKSYEIGESAYLSDRVILLGLVVFISVSIFSLIFCVDNLYATEGEDVMAEHKHYFVRLLGTRDGWPENMTQEEEQIMGEHFYYLKDLVKNKKVLMAGPVFDPVFGLIVLQANSRAEAIEIMNNEPSVVKGLHTYEISEMKASLVAEILDPEKYVTDQSERILHKESMVKSSLEEVWNSWTTTKGVKTFFSQNANVELRMGGSYEIYFLMNEPYGLRGSEGCRVLSYLPMRMLSFEWNAPPDFGKLRDTHTQVILLFEKLDDGQVKIDFSHFGWGKGEEWDKLYDYFDEAWSHVLDNFENRFKE